MAEQQPDLTRHTTADGRPILHAYFEKTTGEMMVYGGSFFGIVFVAMGAYTASLGLVLIGIVCLFGPFYFYPYLEPAKPRLTVDPDGLFIDGLGFIGWSDLKSMRWRNQAVRSIPNPIFTFELSRPAKDAVRADRSVKPWRRFQTQIWSTRSNGELEVKTGSLDKTPELIEGAINYYWKPKV